MKELLKTLTLSEKIGQLAQLAPFYFIHDIQIEIAGHVEAMHLDEAKIFASGSILGINSAEEMIAVQKKYLARSRHQIPLMFMADVIHGYKTIFPVPLALAASFDPEVTRKAARVAAAEASVSGVHVTFAPMADLSRDPRWGRIVESFGEDPFLIGVMTRASVEGFQGDGVGRDGNVASCVKHYAAYGAAEGGRDYNTVDVSRQSLHSQYLEGYRQAVLAGAKMVMTAFNVVDGIPATVNRYLLRDVLRDLWHFEGVTISDYDSLNQIRAHGVAGTAKETALLGIEGGLDIEMASTAYANHLAALIREGKVEERLLDEAVLRILELKRDLGLFENPFRNADPAKAARIILSPEHLEESLKAARACAVLLENDGILPLSKTATIALVGPYAEARDTIGPWSWHGRRDRHETLAEVFGNRIVFVKSDADPDAYSETDLAAIAAADVTILALGESERLSGEAHSRSDIALPGRQDELFRRIAARAKATVVVLMNGRPLLLGGIKRANAVLETFFLGSMAARAIRELLDGDAVPSGKLPVSFPQSVGQIPVYYNHLNTGRPYLGRHDHNEYVSRYLDLDNEPLYPFGYGLSYARFRFAELRLSAPTMTADGTLAVSVDVENVSDVTGSEVVQLYLHDPVARVARPVKELKAFRKLELPPHAKTTVEFTLSSADLDYPLADGTRVVDPGRFTVMVGPNSRDVLAVDFELL